MEGMVVGVAFAVVLLVVAFLADRQVTRVLKPQIDKDLESRLVLLEGRIHDVDAKHAKQIDSMKSALALKQTFGK